MTNSDDPGELARKTALVEDAFNRGQAALARDDKLDALRWLERASRLAPGENTIRLSLASTLLGLDPSRAAGLFEESVEATDLREAWTGLVAARFLNGDVAGARDALAQVLSHHALPGDLRGLAEAVTSGTQGWCGLTGGGVIEPYLQVPDPVEIRVDRLRISGLRLPADWRNADTVEVTVGGKHLIGSPLLPRAIGRIEGFVEAKPDGLHGWLWHPADPNTDPVVVVETPGFRREIVATGRATGIAGLPPLARPRMFFAPWDWFPKGRGWVRVQGSDGRDLLGGPVPRNMASPRVDRRTSGKPPGFAPDRPPVVAISAEVKRFAGEPELAAVVSRDIMAGAKAWPGHDLVVLRDSVRLPRNWLARLRDAAYAAPDIGTVSAFSNVGIAAFPGLDGPAIARLARKANGARIEPIPFADGPCVYIRRDCLDSAGAVDFGPYAQGSEGLRALCAMTAGWRHVTAPGLFTAQPISTAPDAARMALSARNERLLRLMHPGLEPALEWFQRNDPLAGAKRRLDRARWNTSNAPGAIFVTHDDGGGVERCVLEAAAASEAAGCRAIILRPATLAGGETCVAVSGAEGRGFPNLTFALPREKAMLRRFLMGSRPESVEIHHFLNHAPAAIETVAGLGVPYDVHVHDFIWLCPRIALVGRDGRYCGEPDLAGCEACIAKAGSYLSEPLSVAALRERSRKILAGARRVVAPSGDAARRMARHFPGVTVAVQPHEDDDAIPEPPSVARRPGPVRICVAGAIGLHKGYHVLLACARDARERGLDLTFDLVGTSIDDQSLMDTGHVFVTGPYRIGEAEALIRARGATLGFLPSIWPETWTFALTELWRAGLRVAAFDLGAPAERIRRTGRGFLILPHSPPREINDAFLHAARGDLFFRSRGLRLTSLSTLQP